MFTRTGTTSKVKMFQEAQNRYQATAGKGNTVAYTDRDRATLRYESQAKWIEAESRFVYGNEAVTARRKDQSQHA